MASIIKADTLQSTTANVFVLNTSGTEYARFDSSGKFGVGTTSPSQNLTVAGGLGFTTALSFTGSGYEIGRDGADFLCFSGGSAGTRFINASTSTEFMRFDTAGSLTLASGQIKFPATQNASGDPNTLDDYEEGTWTPVIIGTGTAGTGTYSVQNGRYTKIGNRVYFGVYCVWSAHTGTGDMTMGGLPFTSSGSNFTGVSIRYSNLTCSAGYICTPIVADNRSDIVFQQSAVGAAAVAVGQSLDVAANVIMAGHYFIA